MATNEPQVNIGSPGLNEVGKAEGKVTQRYDNVGSDGGLWCSLEDLRD